MSAGTRGPQGHQSEDRGAEPQASTEGPGLSVAHPMPPQPTRPLSAAHVAGSTGTGDSETDIWRRKKLDLYLPYVTKVNSDEAKM